MRAPCCVLLSESSGVSASATGVDAPVDAPSLYAVALLPDRLSSVGSASSSATASSHVESSAESTSLASAACDLELSSPSIASAPGSSPQKPLSLACASFSSDVDPLRGREAEGVRSGDARRGSGAVRRLGGVRVTGGVRAAGAVRAGARATIPCTRMRRGIVTCGVAVVVRTGRLVGSDAGSGGLEAGSASATVSLETAAG